MKNQLILCLVIASLLIMSFQVTGTPADRPSSKASLSENQAPIVNSPVDIVYVEGSTGHSIVWEISDNNPSYWITTRNGEILNAIPWINVNETVIVNVDGLITGNYEFKIYACDDIHNITDVVLVQVLSSDIVVDTPFSIGNDIEFNTTAQSEGWSGNGSAINPYIIENLYIEASYDCISIHGTTVHFIIRNCTFVKLGIDTGIGIDLQSVSNGTIANCTFANLWIGCVTYFVANCVWETNLFGNLLDGIWLNDATNCSILDNSFMSGGISISGDEPSNWIHVISGNMIGDRSIGYFEGLYALDIDAESYGQVIVANCDHVAIFNGDFSNAGSPISIAHTNSSGVHDCRVNGGRYGIYMERTQNVTIDTCGIFGSSDVGLYVNETSHTTVSSCTIQNIGYIGIIAGMGTDTVIIESVIINCGDSAIIIYETPSVVITNCTLQENYDGIIIGGCPTSFIYGNIIQYNVRYGLMINWESENTDIFGNTFKFNGFANAVDDGIDTFWDDGFATGNTWSDYEGSGFYYVLGSRNGIDHYPQGIDIGPVIEIFDVPDQSYIVGTTGHYIEWITNCTYPSMYSIFKDGILEKQEIWSGSSIIYNIDGLSVGTYNFSLEIQDGVGGTASDSVTVTVIPEGPIVITNTTTTTNTSTTPSSGVATPFGMQEVSLIISIGSASVIVVVVILIIRTRKSIN